MRDELTQKQRTFAHAWIENGGNDYQAAIDAGYSQATAKNARKNILEKRGVKEYIAKLQADLDKEKGFDIMSLADIQRRRSMIATGALQDSFGFTPDFPDQLKAMNDLEKALTVQAKEEEEKKAREEALRNKTYHMDLDIIPDVFHPMIRDVRNHGHTEYVLPGGRGSGKSSTIPNIITELMRNNHDIHCLVVRKVYNTVKDSVFAKAKWAITKQEFSEKDYKYTSSPYEITMRDTGQKIFFRGADDKEKIKSIAPDFGYIAIVWFEELDQFAGPEEIRNIEQSAIRGGDLAWIFKSFNPPKSANNWANQYLQEPKDNRMIVRSTYLDVPKEWLGKPFIEEAEHLKEIRPEAYEHEYMGIANGNGGAVFEYVEVREITDEEIAQMDRIYQGVDWGWYPDKYAFTRTYYDAARETIYFIDEHCVNKRSNEQTADWIKKKGYNDYAIICDSAEPKSVEDYRNLGLVAQAAVKGPGSVEYGMKWLQRRKIVIDPRRTPYAYKEITTYEYDRDKDGNIISGYPDRDNHAIDSLRYAYNRVIMRRGENA